MKIPFHCKKCRLHIGYTENGCFYFQTPSGGLCQLSLVTIPLKCECGFLNKFHPKGKLIDAKKQNKLKLAKN